MNERSVLIVDSGSAAHVLPTARSLARAGWTVGVAAPVVNPRSRHSRAIGRRHPLRSAVTDLDGFVDDLNHAIAVGGYELLVPMEDVELVALSAVRDRLTATFPYADHDVVMRAVDKLLMSRAAEDASLAVPALEPATESAIANCPLPVFVKPRLHWSPGATRRRLHARSLSHRGEVRSRAAEIRQAGGQPLLQELVVGRQLAVSMVIDGDGGVVGAAAQTTLAFSADGPSSRAITIDPEPDLVDSVVRLARALGWIGVLNVQFMQPPGGRPRLIDWNGRPYGSIALAIAAGADLPALWADVATGTRRATCSTARSGVRFQELESDLQRARRERVGGLVPDVVRTLSFAVGAAHTVWSSRDPAPALGWVARLAVRRVGGGSGMALSRA